MPRKDEIAVGARDEQAETIAQMVERAERRANQAAGARETIETGGAEVDRELAKPWGQQALEEVPLVGDWLAVQLYGSAKNTAPDARDDLRPGDALRRSGAFYD